MKLALVQTNPTIGDVAGNVDALLARVGEAARAGAELAVCAELAICGYPPRDLLDQPAFVDANLRALERMARDAAIPVIVGFVDRSPGRLPAGRLRNAAAVIADGRVCSVHHKTLLPTYDVFDEWRYFEPAERVELAHVAGVAVGVSICEDIWNDADFWPERRYRADPVEALAAMGAELLVNISASPFTVHKRRVRRRMLAAQAAKHELPLVMVNQDGGNDDLLFDGGSMALSNTGRIGARAREFAEDLVCVDIDLVLRQDDSDMPRVTRRFAREGATRELAVASDRGATHPPERLGERRWQNHPVAGLDTECSQECPLTSVASRPCRRAYR
jgi:predicted amidohydrolase